MASCRASMSSVNLFRSSWVKGSQEGQYHTGIWWPHQICREMHQSRLLWSQWRYGLAQEAGWIFTFPCSVASAARLARSWVFMNHWLDSRGSITEAQR